MHQLAGGSTPNQASVLGDVQGVDVASFQHPNGAAINWGQVAADGYRFAFVKATQGDYYQNPYFGGDYAAAEGAGLYRSAYHFADPSVSGGATQADDLLNAAAPTVDGRTLPHALDIESVSGHAACYGYSQAGMVAWIAAFSNEVLSRTGRLPIIYTNATWWNQCTGGSSAFASNPLWVASYGSSTPTMPGGWGTWAFWQYTSSGSVPGISGSTDLSFFSGGVTGLGTLAGAVTPSWRSLGGVLTSGPGVASWASNRMDVLVRGGDGAVWHKAWTGGAWSRYESLGGYVQVGTGPAAVSWGPNRIDAFVRGADNQLWHIWWDGTAWSGWQALGGVLTSSPTVASWSAGRLDVLARGSDGGIWHKAWTAGAWSGWESLGGFSASAPAATSWGPNRVDVFVRGGDNGLWHLAWDGVRWQGWEGLGGVLFYSPAASSWGFGRIDVLVLGGGGTPYHRSWAGGWSGWSSLGGGGVADPGVMDPGFGAIFAFVEGSDEALWYTPVPP
ncbi:MAG: hypothetical protein J2P44_00215 [Candidatus Dormibacteraeota bacterium]|nr:hypothetical protein [Candidatus Dormibacteraeota bacterium]